jgi:hypothetical protein
MNTPLDALVLADTQALLTRLSPANPSLSQAMAGNPEAMKIMGEMVLNISRIQTLCAFERPVDLELFSPLVQSCLDRIPELSIVVQHFLRAPALQELNVHLKDGALAATETRFDDYLGSFLL